MPNSYEVRLETTDHPDRFKYRIDAGKIDRLPQTLNSIMIRLKSIHFI